MRKIKFLVCIFFIGFLALLQGKDRTCSDYILLNIEALASGGAGGGTGGGGDPVVFCLGEGSIDCNGHKVSFIIDSFSIK